MQEKVEEARNIVTLINPGRNIVVVMERRGEAGQVTCGSWIKRPENAHLVILGKSKTRIHSPSSSALQIFSFDYLTTSLSTEPLVIHEIEAGDPVSIAVHPTGDDVVCSTTLGTCLLLQLYGGESNLKLQVKELAPLHGAGLQKCLAFSADGSRFATGGEDGHLRIFEWPSLRIILDEPKAHKSVRDMDFSLDSEYLASTSTDGSARVWKTNDGTPLTSLTRNSDERIELCRFSKDGTKPFLFCTVQKGDKSVTAVWDISTWKKIGHKRLLRKPAAIMSVSLDGKYLALGSKDGDFCVAEVKKMEISHWSRRLHPGTSIGTLEFCPSERVMLTSSGEWGAVVTKLNVPVDWKGISLLSPSYRPLLMFTGVPRCMLKNEGLKLLFNLLFTKWQIYVLLVGLFLASALVFYVFFLNSDNFWNFPLGKNQPAKSNYGAAYGDPQASDDHGAFGPLDM